MQKYKKVEEPLYLTITDTSTQYFSKISFKKHDLFLALIITITCKLHLTTR